MPGQIISETDRKKIDAKFICTVCKLLLSTPMQTPCGHLICYVCLEALLSELNVDNWNDNCEAKIDAKRPRPLRGLQEKGIKQLSSSHLFLSPIEHVSTKLEARLCSRNPSCPSDGTRLRKEQVFPDAFTKRELMGLRLHCPNKGCDWSGTYKELQGHLNNCDHALIQCDRAQCMEEVERSLLTQHLQQECLYREVNCDHCKKKLAFSFLEEHVNVQCAAVPLTCKHCGVTGLQRREMKQHVTDECERIPINCEFKVFGCEMIVERKEMRQHLSNAVVTHLQLISKSSLKTATTVSAEQGKIRQELQSLATKVQSLEVKTSQLMAVETRVKNLEWTTTGRGSDDSSTAVGLNRFQTNVFNNSGVDHRRYDQMVEKVGRLEGKLREKDAEIARLRERLDRIDTSMAETTVRLSDMAGANPSQATTSGNGTLLWKIDDFTRKRRDAVSGAQIAIYSPPFYTSQFGYKMCARVYMNGDGFGKNTHISLFFVVMKGDYDALLPWPFQKKITMMLLDQTKGEHMIDAFRSDPESSSFQRPKNNMNVASGSPLFMPLDGLSNRAYVKEETMFIKIIVD